VMLRKAGLPGSTVEKRQAKGVPEFQPGVFGAGNSHRMNGHTKARRRKALRKENFETTFTSEWQSREAARDHCVDHQFTPARRGVGKRAPPELPGAKSDIPPAPTIASRARGSGQTRGDQRPS